MDSPATCTTCASPLPSGASAKQCPACLLKAGMEAEMMPFDAADYPDTIEDESRPASAAPREVLGSMIGRYLLLKEIGEGGFGIVYLAEQSEPVKRRVALKVLKPGMDTREVVARFEAERQALALMDHPNIAQVYDGGVTASGRTPRTAVTGIGQMIGTPQYMSPEQAEVNARDVDTRSDLYSLGIVLYELLNGRTPLDAKQIRDTNGVGIQRLIREQEPPKPSAKYGMLEPGERTAVARRRAAEPAKLAGLLRGDLDWEVMKALEKDRARRYQTVNGLAADIRRFLDDEPVSASPPSTVYRFVKFARRHKFGVAWTAVISVVILTAAVGMTLLYFKAEREAREAEAQRLAAQRGSWEARMSQVSALRWSGRLERRFQAFAALGEATVNPAAREAPENLTRMRDAAIACLAIVDMRPVDSWQGNPGYGKMVTANRAMTACARTFQDGRISILNYSDRSRLMDLPGHGKPVNNVLKFSPDGKRLAAA